MTELTIECRESLTDYTFVGNPSYKNGKYRVGFGLLSRGLKIRLQARFCTVSFLTSRLCDTVFKGTEAGDVLWCPFTPDD